MWRQGSHFRLAPKKVKFDINLPPSPSLLSPSTIDLNVLCLWRSLLHRQLPLLQLETQAFISQPALQLRTGGHQDLRWVLAQELITSIAENVKFVPERRGSCSEEIAPGVGRGGGSGIRDQSQHCPQAQRCCPYCGGLGIFRGCGIHVAFKPESAILLHYS